MARLSILCKFGLHAWADCDQHTVKSYVHPSRIDDPTDHSLKKICRRCGAARAWSASRGRWRETAPIDEADATPPPVPAEAAEEPAVRRASAG